MAPEVLYYDEIAQNRSLNISLKGIDHNTTPVTYADLDRLIIRWVNVEDTAADFDTSLDYPNFPDNAYWNQNYSAPILEIQITPLNKTGFDRQDLNYLAKTIYVYPTSKSPASTAPSHSPSYDPGKRWDQLDSGDIIEGHCGSYLEPEPLVRSSVNKDICTVELMDLMRDLPDRYHGFHPGTSSDEIDFHLRVRSLYSPAHLEIRGYSYKYSGPRTNDWQQGLDSLDNRQIKFREIQAVVGATGHAGNVQVRLEERFRLQPIYDYPEHGVQSSQTICKTLISDQDEGTDVTNTSVAPQNLPVGTDLGRECSAF